MTIAPKAAIKSPGPLAYPIQYSRVELQQRLAERHARRPEQCHGHGTDQQ